MADARTGLGSAGLPSRFRVENPGLSPFGRTLEGPARGVSKLRNPLRARLWISAAPVSEPTLPRLFYRGTSDTREPQMAVNMDKPQRWKADIAESVDAFNRWFIAYAPAAFREQRRQATADVEDAMAKTSNLTAIGADILATHPSILPTLRMATCPPLARDRLVGLAGVSKNLVMKMDDEGLLPPRMRANELQVHLSRMGSIIGQLVDVDICPWIPDRHAPSKEEIHRAATVIADRLCGAVANPIIRNAQEKRQLGSIQAWLEERGYRALSAEEAKDAVDMAPGTFCFRMNVGAWMDDHGVNTVNVPVDAVIKGLSSKPDALPLFVEAKSASDFTNVNKRRKEEAAKAQQLRRRYGQPARFVLFLGGYFDSGYLGYEAAESIDWVWEHRIDDFAEFGL